MARILRRTQFGNPLLRQQAKRLSKREILSEETHELIVDIKKTLKTKKYGVGLAAPQVGTAFALAVIQIRPTKMRPKLPKEKWAELVIINPKITKTSGRRQQLWEGCISFTESFAKVPRYKKIELEYIDEKAKKHKKSFDGLLAHVIQHEVDHLNGILFVDKVKDPTTFITASEYKKRIVNKERTPE